MTTQPPDSPPPPLDELISLAEAAEVSGISASHLRLLVRNGQMWGKKIGRNWVTTRGAVQAYLALEKHPGRPPKSETDDSPPPAQ